MAHGTHEYWTTFVSVTNRWLWLDREASMRKLMQLYDKKGWSYVMGNLSFHMKPCNYSRMSQGWISLRSPSRHISRSATAPLSTEASLNTRGSRSARPTTTSHEAACVRPVSSQSWAAASPPWGPNSTHITSCATSAWSLWAKAASRSRRTNPTATHASSNCLDEPNHSSWKSWRSCVNVQQFVFYMELVS